jgi:glycolate oxidase subunit GlcD
VRPDFLTGLAAIVGPDAVITEPAGRWVYGYDNSRRHADPAAVVFATSPDEVRDIVALCGRERASLVARGRGTGTTGSAVPLGGGVVLALERMNRILRTQPDDRLMVVQPGVTNDEVQREAARHGFFWPPDPTSGAFCTVGGNLALNAAGPRAVKYGTARENVLGLRAVTGSGEEIRTGVYTTKGVVGYDLTRLIVGSEGTLAIITEAVLKLAPLPEAKRTLRAIYRDVHAAARAVASIMAQPVTPCTLEFMDARAIELVRVYRGVELPAGAGAMLMVEVDGPAACVQQASNQVAAAAEDAGLMAIAQARTEAEIAQLWEARKALSPALRHFAPKKINEDVVVPVSRLPELMDGVEDLSRRHAVTIANFGHAGNGNIHVNLLVNPDDADQVLRAERCLSDLFDLVLSLQGTLSGEHGVGMEKRDFVPREIDPVTLALMGRIKAQFDPQGILNPGKLLPLQPNVTGWTASRG